MLGIGFTALPASNAKVRQQVPMKSDAARGQKLYQVCTGCHSLDENDVGPRHRGIMGRTAGTVADYRYSDALKASGIKWAATNMDKWLSNPRKMVPGTKMYFSVAKPQDRADIIAYLQKQD